MTRAETTKEELRTEVDKRWTVYQQDARATGSFLQKFAADLGDESAPFLTTTLTSPPYANLVDYGTKDQIGFGQSYEDYLNECETIFRDLFEWTVDAGSLWVVADTMMGQSKANQPSALIPLPFALAERAALAGWTLRDVIIWRKDRTRPWTSAGRLRNGFEYILFFVKGPSFKYHIDRLRDLRGLKHWWVKYPERHNPWGMTPDNVWEIPIPVQGSWASNDLRHACPFPQELVRRVLELSTDPEDVVFDPFAGSGMVPAVAESLGRRPLGTELNPEFCKVYVNHVRPTVLGRESEPLDVDTLDITATLLRLRVLKFPKILLNQIMRAGVKRSDLLGAIALPEALDLTPKASPYAELDCTLVVPTDTSSETIATITQTAARALAQAPLTKWGVRAQVGVLRVDELTDVPHAVEQFSVYIGGRTWKANKTAPWAEVLQLLENTPKSGVPPIISSVSLSVELEE